MVIACSEIIAYDWLQTLAYSEYHGDKQRCKCYHDAGCANVAVRSVVEQGVIDYSVYGASGEIYECRRRAEGDDGCKNLTVYAECSAAEMEGDVAAEKCFIT